MSVVKPELPSGDSEKITVTKYITHLNVSLDAIDEQRLQSQGFEKINVDLNRRAGGNSIYIWYQRSDVPITRVQISFNDEMAVGLVNAGYTKIDKDLNAGAGGDVIYLWYFRGSDREFHTPITELDVTKNISSGAKLLDCGWERLDCDLNRGTEGSWIHLWVKRNKQTYIREITATNSYRSDVDLLKSGYIRMDEVTNRDPRAPVFLWYRQTTEKKEALTDLMVSISDEEVQELKRGEFCPVSVKLNKGSCSTQVQLWYKKDKFNKPIKTISLLLNTWAADMYERSGVTVIKKDLNAGTNYSTDYLCFYR